MISVSLSVAQGFIASRSSWRTGEGFSSLCWSLCRRGDFAEIQQKEMALVLMCGQPCSGKSTAAACLKEALEKRSNVPVILIDEPSLNLDRNESYQDMPREKNLRGLLRSAVDRAVSRDSIVIVDSLNNIKGYRYELWCLARASGVRYCVLHCITGEEQCRAWNEARQQQGVPSFNNHIFDDLVRRFERPDGKNRWDSRLFELQPSAEEILDGSEAIVDAVDFITQDKQSGGARNSQVLQPTIATQNVRASETNSLYELDRATQEVVSALVDAQAQGAGGVVRNVSVGEGLPFVSAHDDPNILHLHCDSSMTNTVFHHVKGVGCKINLNRSVALPELRRLRRTFLKLAGQSSLSGPPPPSDAKSAKRMFADYLNGELSTNLIK